MSVTAKEESLQIPYQYAMPKDALPEIVIPNAIPTDDR